MENNPLFQEEPLLMSKILDDNPIKINKEEEIIRKFCFYLKKCKFYSVFLIILAVYST